MEEERDFKHSCLRRHSGLFLDYSYIALSEHNKSCHLQQTSELTTPGYHEQKGNKSIGWIFYVDTEETEGLIKGHGLEGP